MQKELNDTFCSPEIRKGAAKNCCPDSNFNNIFNRQIAVFDALVNFEIGYFASTIVGRNHPKIHT